MKTRPIVIIGGGFAGVRAALELDRLLGGDLEYPIYLINPTPYHTYTPRFFDILSSTSPRVATIPLADIFERTAVHFLAEEVTRIDTDDKVVLTEKRRLPYADLVIAVENQPWPNVEKEEEYGTMLTCNDIEAILTARAKIVASCTKAATIKDTHTVFVVGGGVRGVEFIAGLRSFFMQVPDLPRTAIHFVLAEAEKRLLPAYAEQLSEVVAKFLLRERVTLKLRSKLTPDELRQQLKTTGAKNHTVVWAVGMKAHPLVSRCKGLPHDSAGRIEVVSSLQVRGHDTLWAAGDSAALPDNQSTAGAIAHGKHIAHGIMARRADKTPTAYMPIAAHDIIQLAPRFAVTWSPAGIHEGTFPMWQKHQRDLRYFLSILPKRKALRYWRSLARVTHEDGAVCYRLHD